MNTNIKSKLAGVLLRGAVSCLLLVSFLPGAILALSHDPPVDRFEFAIKQFESRDRTAMPDPGRTLFIGSSTFAHWHSLEQDLKECNALNRGFGGSTIPEVNHYIDRIAINYKPARVVFYAGTNDIADGHSAKRISDDFIEFASKVHSSLPQTQIYFISMSVAPSRMQWKSVYDEGNQLIRQYATRTNYIHYIDVLPVMRTADGKLKEEYFLPDRLHMTSEGYAQWTPIIKAALAGDSKSAK
jgi:lysophospholipase L1-like esterase